VPYWGRWEFFPSPPKPFTLPPYVEAISEAFVASDPRPYYRARSVDPRVLQFIDDFAVESDPDTVETGNTAISCDSSL